MSAGSRPMTDRPNFTRVGDNMSQNTAQAGAGWIARRHPRTENTASGDIFTGIVPFRRTAVRRHAALTKTGRSRISRANCPRWPGSTGAAHLGRKRPVSGRSALTDLSHSSANCPVSGERPVKRTYQPSNCLLYTSDAADEEDSVDLGGRRIIKKKK